MLASDSLCSCCEMLLNLDLFSSNVYNHRGGPVFRSVSQQQEIPSITMECFMDERCSSEQKVWLLWVLATLWVGLDLHHFRKLVAPKKKKRRYESDGMLLWRLRDVRYQHLIKSVEVQKCFFWSLRGCDFWISPHKNDFGAILANQAGMLTFGPSHSHI